MGFPDLIVDSITWSPANPNTGQTVTFTVTVRNQGGGGASASHVYYFVDGAQKDYDYTSSIAAGAASTQTFTWSAEPGSHVIKAIADYNSAVPESSETNNQKEVTFSMGFPDLIVDSITWSPANPNTGQTVTFTVTVRNQGGGGASASHVYYFVDGAQKDYDYTSSIAAGAASTQTFTWSAEPGSHVIKAIADYNSAVPESSETNNQKEVTLIIP
jgi:subtilase family serine protease